MSTKADSGLSELPSAQQESVLGEKERVAAALFGHEATPTMIGKYRVDEVLGRGAMGVVYEAWDEELQRTVAVKLIADDLEAGGAEVRFRREALALGKLAHPNVVTVHEVGTHKERLFIAMELVRGQTLDAWLRGADRSWRDCLDVFVQAGRGLDAAHQAGLVHRDFKPANCIVGETGRVRVLDFGLARGSADFLDEEVAATFPAVSTLDVSVTRTGATVGTPAYMAPEQLRGGDVTASSDQFAFCTALYEALEGVRPFAGKSVVEIYENIEAGRFVRGSGRAPGEVFRMVERGLAVTPGQRWATLGELVDALEAVPHRRARRRVVGGVVAAGVLAAAVVGAAWIPQEPCEDLPQTEVWNADRRATLEAAMGGGAAWATLDDAVSKWTRAWDGLQASACRAARVDGSTNEVVLARQRVCMLQRERTTETLLRNLVGATSAAKYSPAVLLQLPSLGRCGHGNIMDLEPPPLELELEVDAVRVQIDESRAAWVVGDTERAEAAATAAWAAAGDLEYGPVRAEAGVRLGTVRRESAPDRGAAVLVRAFTDAETAGDDPTAAEAAMRLMEASTYAGRPEAASRWHSLAWAKLQRIGAGPRLRAELAAGLVDLSLLSADFEAARVASDEALAGSIEADGRNSLQYAHALAARARVLDQMTSGAQVDRAYGDALAAFQDRTGPDHFLFANTQMNRGMSRLESGDYDGARRDLDTALPVVERADMPRLLVTLLVARAQLGSMTGELTLDALDRIHGLLDTFGGEDTTRIEIERVTAAFYLRLGETDRARELFEHIVAVARRTPDFPAVQLAMDVNNVGECLLEEQRWVEAAGRFEASRAVLERALQPDDLRLAYVLTGLGRALVGQQDLDRARPLLERSLRILELEPGDVHLLAHTQLALARTLGNSERAQVLNTQAREVLSGSRDDREEPKNLVAQEKNNGRK